MSDPADLSLGQAVELLRARELSPAELVDSCLQRARTHADLGALVILDEGRARRAAAESHPGPLYGTPLVVKDLIDLEGLPTRAGTATSSASAAARDAAIVAGLRSRGAIVIGKAATHECVKPGAVLITPALPGPPPAHGRPNHEVVRWLTRLLAPVNAAGLAAAVVPEGPCGVQLIAHDEDTVLAAIDRLG